MPIERNQMIRNDYFTYIKASNAKGTLVTRESVQIWNHASIAMQIQGTYQRKGKKTENSFAKKHLIVVNADGKGAEDKMKSTLAKRRDFNLSFASRGVKFTKLKGQGMKATEYPTQKVYGDSKFTGPANTVLLLDGNVTSSDMKDAFATAIKGETFSKDDDKHLVVDFGTACVHNVEDSGVSSTAYSKMKVSVYFDGVIYHIYHCIGPEV